MALSLATVGGKITAALFNAVVGIANSQGASLVVPTSVAGTGVTVSLLGKVTLTAATTASLNGCFTGTFDNYTIIADVTHSVTAALTVKLRASGTDTSALSYSYLLEHASGATVTASSGNVSVAGGIPIQGIGGLQTTGRMDVYSPAISSTPTRFDVAKVNVGLTATTFGMASYAGNYNVNAAFDGATLSCSGGNMTGTVRVYGWNNG